jgi:tRNA G37 N-methylase TrmD
MALAKSQKNLKKWTNEKWRTSDGKPANRPGGTTRYLPDAAWKSLTPAQKAATNRKKVKASKQGKQFTANTPAAKKAGKIARQK